MSILSLYTKTQLLFLCRCKETSAIDESAFSHEPTAYEVPVVTRKQQQQQTVEAQYSVVKPVNNEDSKRDQNEDGHFLSTLPTLDNPVYMTGCVGGLDHQYSSLNHQVQLSATTHDDQQSLQRDDTDSDGQYSKIKINESAF